MGKRCISCGTKTRTGVETKCEKCFKKYGPLKNRLYASNAGALPDPGDIVIEDQVQLPTEQPAPDDRQSEKEDQDKGEGKELIKCKSDKGCHYQLKYCQSKISGPCHFQESIADQDTVKESFLLTKLRELYETGDMDRLYEGVGNFLSNVSEPESQEPTKKTDYGICPFCKQPKGPEDPEEGNCLICAHCGPSGM